MKEKMIFIEGIHIEAFSPRMAFVNNTSVCDEKYGYLERAITRSKVHRDGHNYLIGENIQTKNEYLNYHNNMLIVVEKDDEFKFIVIIKSKIFDVTNDAEDQNVKMVLSTQKISVVDQYGKKLLINNHDELLEFISAVKKSRENFNIKLDEYHNYMDRVYEFKRAREESVDCYINTDYDRIVDLADDLSKSMIDMLTHFHDSEEQKIVEKYIYKPSREEKLCVLFGLYVAVFRAYLLNYDCENSSMTLDEKIRNKFQKELNYFIEDHDDIFENYAKYFALKPVEVEEIKQLFKDCDIDVDNLQEYFDYAYKKGRLDGKGGLSPRTLKLHRIFLNQVLNNAICGKILKENPIK